MIGVLTLFVGELRQVGIPVSMVESIDAALPWSMCHSRTARLSDIRWQRAW